MTHSLFPLIWVSIIAFCIIMYVILDGFTLGTGLLMPWLDRHEREIASSVILPTWDGNQTWLVLGAASLYGAFPLAFSSILPVMYLPLMLMVISLLFRGVTFEFRLKAQNPIAWDWIFAGASFIVTVIQGLIVGNFVEGFVYSVHPYIVTNRAFVTPFSLFTALSLIVGYCLLSTTRLVYKTEGHLQQKMYRYARFFSICIFLALIIVSIWTPFVHPKIYHRWFTGMNWLYLMSLPYLALLAFLVQTWSLRYGEDHIPFWCSVCLFLCPFIGLGVSVYPYIVPYRFTIWQAAAPDNTLTFLLVGAVIMLPVLLIYTGYSYHIFKGKVKSSLEY